MTPPRPSALPRTGPLVLGLAGTLLDPAVVFEAVASASAAPVVPVDWLPLGGTGGLQAAQDQLVKQIKATRRDPVRLIGHSSGGFLALLLAVSAPDLVAGVVTVNTGADTINHGDPAAPDRFAAGITDAVLDPFLARCFARSPAEETLQRLRDYARRTPAGHAVAAMRSQRAMSVTDQLGSIAAPVVAIHGVRDQVRSIDRAIQIADGVRHGALVPVDCGHTAPIESPRLVTAVLDRLIHRPASNDIDWSTTWGA